MNKSLLLLAPLLSAAAAPTMAQTFVVPYAQPAAVGPTAATPPSQPPGLYVQVLDGLVVLAAAAGSQTFGAGQFGFVGPASTTPVILPANPGVQFTPPPAFNASVAGSAATATPKGVDVDCVVR